MKAWRVAVLGVVVLALFACNSEGGSPSEPLSAPNDPLFATNVDALLKVDKIRLMEEEGLLELTLSLNRGLFGAGYSDPEFTCILELRNSAGQIKDFHFMRPVDLIKPLTPPTQGLVVIALVEPWDGKDSQGVPMTGAILAEWNVQLQFQAGGKTHTLATSVASGDVNIVPGPH